MKVVFESLFRISYMTQATFKKINLRNLVNVLILLRDMGQIIIIIVSISIRSVDIGSLARENITS